MAQSSFLFDNHILQQIERWSNLEEIKSIIKNGNLYYVTGDNNNTLLHYAAKCGNMKVVQYLIESGSSIDSQNIFGETPIMIAITNMTLGRSLTTYVAWRQVVKNLLEAGADIYVSNKRGKSALHMVGQIDSINQQTLRLFLKKLQTDFSSDREEIVKRLLDADWPLYNIVASEDAELTKIILQSNFAVKMNASSRSGKTALHFAVENTDVENVRVLLEYSTNFGDADNNMLYQSLTYVYPGYDRRRRMNNFNEKLNILEMLFERINIKDLDFRRTYRIFAYANEEAIKLLFSIGIGPMEIVGHADETAVHALAHNENSGAIELLRNHVFDINVRNRDGQTPLMYAAMVANIRGIEFLLNEGADVNALDKEGRTAWYFIINLSDQKERCVQILLEHGANVETEVTGDFSGTTIFDKVWVRQTVLLEKQILAHLALQEAQGTPFTQLMRKKIESTNRFKDFFALSKQQLNMEIYKPITLLDLFSATDRRLERHVRNEEFLLKIPDFMNSLDSNYYFYHRLQNRISKANEMVTLKNQVASLICKVILTMDYERFPHVVDNIVDCLKQQDMRNLMDAFVDRHCEI